MQRIYPAELQPLLQSLFSTLADIDYAHDCDVERLEKGAGDSLLKEQTKAKLDEEHRQRREPYVQQIALLEAEFRAKVGARGDRDAA
jgi:hypothetical protein